MLLIFPITNQFMFCLYFQNTFNDVEYVTFEPVTFVSKGIRNSIVYEYYIIYIILNGRGKVTAKF